jgi:hypothetical protein
VKFGAFARGCIGRRQQSLHCVQFPGESLGDPVVALDSRLGILRGTRHVSVFIRE